MQCTRFRAIVTGVIALLGFASPTLCAPITEAQFKQAVDLLATVYALREKDKNFDWNSVLTVSSEARLQALREKLQGEPAEKHVKAAIEQLTKVRAALPDKAQAQPVQPRKVLIFTRAAGFRHSSIELGGQAVQWLGQTTGAFESTVSDDPEMFAPDKLNQFDAVVAVSTTQDIFTPPTPKDAANEVKDAVSNRGNELEKSLETFIAGGKGWAGIHAAGDMGDKRPEYRALVGGTFQSHPWHEKVTVRVEDPRDAVSAAFTDPGFEITDEIYVFKEPWAREKMRVLLSLDMSKTAPKGKREDNDYAVSWVKNYDQGRVFYCSLGHREEIYWNPLVLKHYLDGIQFALGDLKADTASHPIPPGSLAAFPQEPTDTIMGEYVGTWLPSQVAAVSPQPARAQVIAEGKD
ncbi:MAG: ThuA domain-containing protein, partial [Armatimonadota bacterium]|nr:ThuA domain-containing protein [Armatimonadota bacterium]